MTTIVNASDRPAGWWKSAVVYQIYPRSFADSNGDGIGDIPGVVGKLDYLKELGVDVVWLSPAYKSPQDDNGYDISDYQDIDPMFGTLDDVDALIAGLHERGMKLVMDLVVNHTSDEHAWFQSSRDKDSDKRDWYWWRPAREGRQPGEPGAEPTNWGSFFSGSGWEFDEQSGEYYLHLFSRKQPDLNWENPEVRQAVYDMMNWWLDRGVDGFRMDVINLISKTLPLADGAVDPGMTYSYDFSLVSDGPRMHEFLHEMNQRVLAGKNLITVGEMPGVTVDEARLYSAADREELNMVFQFEHMGIDIAPGMGKWGLKKLSWPALKANLARWQDGLGDAGWNSLYWDNHDQPRAVSRFGDDSAEHRENSAKTLATILHMQKGTPYVYQGEELGMTNAGFTSIDQYRDIESLNAYAEAVAMDVDPSVMLASLAAKGRDNARTPMQWDASPNAGFTTGEPWLPANPNHVEINAEAAVADPASVFHHYRRLITLRHDYAVVREGRFELLLPDDEAIVAYTRTLDEQVLVVVANVSGNEVSVPADALPDLDDAMLLLGTHEPEEGLTLAPWESRVYLVG